MTAAARLRHHLLDDVVYHGWPREWVESAPKFEEVGVIETGDGLLWMRVLACSLF